MLYKYFFNTLYKTATSNVTKSDFSTLENIILYLKNVSSEIWLNSSNKDCIVTCNGNEDEQEDFNGCELSVLLELLKNTYNLNDHSKNQDIQFWI